MLYRHRRARETQSGKSNARWMWIFGRSGCSKTRCTGQNAREVAESHIAGAAQPLPLDSVRTLDTRRTFEKEDEVTFK